MPIHLSSEKGNLFIKIDVVIPQILTEKQIESIFYFNNFKLLNCYSIKEIAGDETTRIQ